MKRIINGKTYNTETATKIAEECYGFQYHHELGDPFNQLYQTRFGAYFALHGNDAYDECELSPLTPEEAREWMEKNASVELIEAHFGVMPEAGESESRFTLRMPDSLKIRIDKAAKIKGQSTNAWVVRCLEQGVLVDEKSS